jgi:type IV pilus assembly protein PilO
MALHIDPKDKLNQVVFLVILVVLAGCYMFWDNVYVPMNEQIRTQKEEEDKLARELTKVKSQVQRMAKLKEELARAEVDFAKLQEMFPDQEQIPTRLQDLTSVTRRSGTTTTKFQPLPAVQKEYYTENKYKLNITGSYHSVGEMFAEMANFRYPTSVQKMSIEVSPKLKEELDNADKHGTTPNTVVTEFEFTTYTSRK